MLQVHALRKSYGASVVLADASFIINDGEHVALIGPNGSGKSTLLRCITGQEEPDGGTLTLSPAGATIGYLPQSFAALAEQTVAEMLAEAQAEPAAAEAAMQQAAEALATAADYEAALARYEAALARYEALGGYEREHRAQAILQALDLAAIEPATPVALLSGGQKTRLGLATLLLREPDLLLLDEPTNHLDVEALEWLEEFVRRYPGAALIVSHDREFLDRTVTRTLYLDSETHTIRSYNGGYSDFVAAREHERDLHEETWRRQQEYVSRVESDIRRHKGEALAIELSTTPRQPSIRKLAKKRAQLAKSRERKLERYLESDERVEKPQRGWGLKLELGPPPPGGRAVLRLEELSFAYPGCAPLFSGLSLDVQHGERIALIGPNGAGKSTLLRLIAGALVPGGGTLRLGANIRVGVVAQEHETLALDRTVLQTVLQARPMSETEARNFLHFFLFGGDSVFRRVGECSLGERSRLQLALLVLSGCNLLLLDEPLNHLDIEGREHFEEALGAFEGTVIAVAHDRAFLRSFAERIVEVRDGRARVIEGDYEHFLAQRP